MTAAEAPDPLLAQAVTDPARLRRTATGFWSALPAAEEEASYDRMARGYDLLVGNSLYNRLIWGNWASAYTETARRVVAMNEGGPILDCGCGSLVFTANAYRAGPLDRMVLLDRSIGMLARARDRLASAHYLQGDALDLPFADGHFTTVVSWGMLHIFGTASRCLAELERVAAPGAIVATSSLVLTGRTRGDRMLAMLRSRGEVAEPQPWETVRDAFAARFDLISAEREGGSMLTLVGRRR